MALLGGLHAEQQSASANKPHIASFATARTAANDTLAEWWNGTTNAARRFVVDKDGKPYSNAWTAGDIFYAVAGGVTGVRRMDSLAIGSAYSYLRVNSGATAPEYGGARRLLNVNTTSVSTVGIGEDDLMSYALPANTLAADGEVVLVTVFGTMVTGGVPAPYLRFYAGSSLITVWNGTVLTGAGTWYGHITLIRTGASSATLSSTTAFDARITAIGHNVAVSETWIGSVTLKLTGEDGGGTNAITQTGMIVEHLA